MNTLKKVKSALISVFHKDGLDEIVRTLHELDVKIYSTGDSRLVKVLRSNKEDSEAKALGTLFGIGDNFAKGRQVDYVLAPFSIEEQKSLSQYEEKACEMVLSFASVGIGPTMTKFNN